MKQLTVLSLFISIFLIGRSQPKSTIICGNVLAKERFNVKFFEPVNGYDNLPMVDTNQVKNSILINHKDSIYKQIDISNNYGFVTLYFTNSNNEFLGRVDLLVVAGDSIHINFDLTIENPALAECSGSNAAGHKLFNKIKYKPIEIYTSLFKALDKLIASKNTDEFIKDVDSSVEFYGKKFESLYKNNLINKEYSELMKLNFKLILYDFACSKFTISTKGSNSLGFQKREIILQTLFKKLPPSPSKLKGLYHSKLYLTNYYSYLACKTANVEYIDGLEIDTSMIVDGKVLKISKFEAAYMYIEDKSIQADIWALNLLHVYALARGALDKTSIDRFMQLFPKNNWEKYLIAQLKNYSDISTIDYKLQSPVVFIDTIKNVESLSNLVEVVSKGKPIFIDVWASWCGPCIGAFAYNQQLDSFLILNNIDKIYVSTDVSGNKWKDAINTYSLGGYHIQANERLIENIKLICGLQNEIGLQIPRYIIIDKNGKVFNSNASSPSNINVLEEELKKVIALH